MQDKPFMPKATAVWLVENTKISFKQIFIISFSFNSYQ